LFGLLAAYRLLMGLSFFVGDHHHIITIMIGLTLQQLIGKNYLVVCICIGRTEFGARRAF
jgi:hypothetical protein